MGGLKLQQRITETEVETSVVTKSQGKKMKKLLDPQESSVV